MLVGLFLVPQPGIKQRSSASSQVVCGTLCCGVEKDAHCNWSVVVDVNRRGPQPG
jgi:hypothetical protein